jgi:hypothetical protein
MTFILLWDNPVIGSSLTKTKSMKKILAFAVLSASLFACNDAAKTGDTAGDADTTTTSTTTTTTTTNQYNAADGDVSYRNGRLMVWRNGNWTESNEDVTLDNGVVVRRNGEARRDKDVVTLNDGEVVDRSGNFWDRTGNAIEDGWDATKRGAKKAGQKIEQGAEKVADKTKDVLDGDNKKDNN